MKTSRIYKSEMKAARRLFGWLDVHPCLTNVIIVTAAVFGALCVFLYYPL